MDVEKPDKAMLICEAHGVIAYDVPVAKVEEEAKKHRDDLFCYYVIHVIAKVMMDKES